MASAPLNHSKLDRRALSRVALVFTMYCVVSGGPFGLEPGIQQSGPGMSILLLLVVPLVWAVPVALMTAELTSAIPVEGGYYGWTKRALGPFWGFQCAWWTWLYSIVDATLYPILFGEYLSALIQLSTGWQLLPIARWAVAFVVIVVFTALNVRGTKLVGKSSIALGLILTAPFLVMVATGLWRMVHEAGPIIRSFIPQGSSVGSVFASGLYVIMWNYLGWDNLSTVAEEVDQPQKNFPRALFLTVPLVTGLYVLVVLVGLRFSPDLTKWNDQSWPHIAADVGGRTLGSVVGFAALASAIALFSTDLLSASRIPFVLAEDRFLPQKLVEVHPKFRTPWIAVMICGALYAILSFLFSFISLIEINVTLYSAAVILELVTLVKLRRSEPDLRRPFRIPGGLPCVLLVAALPILVIGIAIVASLRQDGPMDQVPVLILLATGPIFYAAAKRLQSPR